MGQISWEGEAPVGFSTEALVLEFGTIGDAPLSSNSGLEGLSGGGCVSATVCPPSGVES